LRDFCPLALGIKSNKIVGQTYTLCDRLKIKHKQALLVLVLKYCDKSKQQKTQFIYLSNSNKFKSKNENENENGIFGQIIPTFQRRLRRWRLSD